MRPMKAVMIVLVAAIAFAVIMISLDVLVHDQTLSEAWKGSPDQFWQSMLDLVSLAWQYKVVTAIVFGIIVAILLVRQVPDKI